MKNDAKITFTISKGADPDEKVSVPDIKNMTKSEIESWIKENKLTKAKITTTYNETVEKDKVISYEVKGVDEADFTRSSTMNISVSKGPQPAGTVTVTDFKDKYYTEAESWAKTNKINLEKVEVYNDKVESGKVVSQSVAANKTMKQNETLTVTVSKGKGVKVPDIYKMNKEEIEAWAAKNGIVPTVTTKYSNSDSHVLSANVKAGQTISSSDDVQITLNAGKYFYAADEGLKNLIGMYANKLEDWCNQKRSKGIDAFAGNWSGSSEVYSETYSKGQIVSYEISSYSTGQKYDINDRLPLDARFNIVVSKGKYYNLEDNFSAVGPSETVDDKDKATVNDLIEYLSKRYITFNLASDITTDDYSKPARIAGVDPSKEVMDDTTYTIEKAPEGGYWKIISKSNPSTGSGSNSGETGE